MNKEFNDELIKILYDYDCIGSWWSFDDKIPVEIKDSLCEKYNIDYKTIYGAAMNYCQDSYSECKPRPLSDSSADLYRFAKDFG